MRRLIASAPPTWREACALTLLALALNAYTLGSRSIVLDEGGSLQTVQGSIVSLVPVLTGGDPNMGLYYVLLHFWIRLFGDSEIGARSLSALFAALAVPTLYFLGARLFQRTVGLLAAVLFALNSFVMHYAQLARSYALLVFLVTLASYFFVKELEQPSKRTRIAYLLTGTLAIYAHYFAAYVLLVHAITLIALHRHNAFTRQWLTVAAMILVLSTPEILFAYRAGTRGISWIEPPSLNDIGRVFVNFAGGSEILFMLLLVGGCYAISLGLQERRSWPYGFVAAWLLVPVALAFAVSFVQPMFVPAYLIICIPALMLCAAAAIAQIHRPAVAGAIVLLLVGFSARDLVGYYRNKTAENWRDAAKYVLGAASPGDAIVFYPSYARKPFDYYVQKSNTPGPQNIQRQSFEGKKRIWLIIRESDTKARGSTIAQLQSRLREHHQLSDKLRFYRVGIELYALRETSSPSARR